MNRTVKNIIISAILVIVVLIVFLPCLNSDFTNYDDDLLVTKNAKIRSLSLYNVKTIFTEFHEYLYHPLVLLSYAVDYHFFGLNSRVFHATNLLFHMLNCLLVFWLFFIISKRIWAAFLIAVLFGIHPMHVQSVAWISERKDVMYAFFFLGSIISYLYYLRSGPMCPQNAGNKNILYYSASIILFLLALLSKPMAFTLPVVLLLFDFILRREFNKRLLIEKAPFFIMSLIFGIIAIVAHKPAGYITTVQAIPLFNRLFISSYSIIFYLKKLIWPANLSCIYQYPVDISGKLPFSFLITPVYVLILAIAVVWSLKYTRKIFFGALFFLVTIGPVLQLIPVGGGGTPGDHYTYIPALGIFFIASAAVFWIYDRYLKSNKIFSAVFFVMIAAVILALSAAAYKRSLVWKDSISLWTDMIRQFPNYSLAYNNRGIVYARKGQLDKAIKDYGDVIRLKPRDASAYCNRGNVYYELRKYDDAIDNYTKSIESDPSYLQAYNNRGVAYTLKKDYDKALADFAHLIKSNPVHADAYNNRGNLYSAKGEYDSAIGDYTKAINVQPSPAAYVNRSRAYKALGDEAKARDDKMMAESLSRRPAALSNTRYSNYAEAYNIRGSQFYAKGDFDKAISCFTQAIKLQPGFARAYNNRGVAYGRKGDVSEAISDFSKAIEIDPNNAEAYINRAFMHSIRKNYTGSVVDFNAAARLKPDNPMIYMNRAAAHFFTGDYDSAWNDVKKVRQLGKKVSPEFLSALKSASNREE